MTCWQIDISLSVGCLFAESWPPWSGGRVTWEWTKDKRCAVCVGCGLIVSKSRWNVHANHCIWSSSLLSVWVPCLFCGKVSEAVPFYLDEMQISIQIFNPIYKIVSICLGAVVYLSLPNDKLFFVSCTLCILSGLWQKIHLQLPSPLMQIAHCIHWLLLSVLSVSWSDPHCFISGVHFNRVQRSGTFKQSHLIKKKVHLLKFKVNCLASVGTFESKRA